MKKIDKISFVCIWQEKKTYNIFSSVYVLPINANASCDDGHMIFILFEQYHITQIHGTLKSHSIYIQNARSASCRDSVQYKHQVRSKTIRFWLFSHEHFCHCSLALNVVFRDSQTNEPGHVLRALNSATKHFYLNFATTINSKWV